MKNWRALRELLLWCLPALACGGLVRGLFLGHFPYGYIHPDSPDFLVTADRFLNHHRFVIHTKRQFLAPVLFLLPLLVKIPCVLIIAWAQHFFGLIYIVMTGAIIRCWTGFWKRWIVPATLLAALNPAVLYYEHTLISESQYLWCVTALALAGSANALERTRGRFIMLMLALLLTAGSRPEGKLFILFCLLLIPLLHWGVWRKLAIFGAITLAFCMLAWLSSRNTQAGLHLYATLLPLAPETPKSAPDFGPVIAPLRNERLTRGMLAIPDLAAEGKRIWPLASSYLKAKDPAGKWPPEQSVGSFCQRLAMEAARNRPFLVLPITFDKFLLGTTYPLGEVLDKSWLQDMQINSCSHKPWMLRLMPRLTGQPIYSMDDLAAYARNEFPPLEPDWFGDLQRVLFFITTGARIPWPGQTPATPGIPLFYLLGATGMMVGMIRPGSMRKFHIAWVIALGFTGFAVMLTGPVIPRYRFVFEPFVFLYLFVLADGIVALAKFMTAAMRKSDQSGRNALLFL